MIRKRDRSQTLYYIGMIAPATILFFSIIAIPIIRSLILGFTKYDVFDPSATKWIGLENYVRMFSDPLFWRAFKNNIFVIAVSVLGQIPLAFILSFILHRNYVKFKTFFMAMVFLPQTISVIIIGLLWRWIILNPRGLLSQIYQIITGDPNAALEIGLNPSTAMIPIGIVLIWMYTGFYVLIFSANLQKMSPSIIEAAEVDGASEWHIFKNIVLPSQLGIIVVNTILSIAGSLKGFDLIWAMTGGGPADYTIVLPIYMYKYAFRSLEDDAYSYGSAIATTIVVLSVLLIIISRVVGNKADKALGLKD